MLRSGNVELLLYGVRATMTGEPACRPVSSEECLLIRIFRIGCLSGNCKHRLVRSLHVVDILLGI